MLLVSPFLIYCQWCDICNYTLDLCVPSKTWAAALLTVEQYYTHHSKADYVGYLN